MIFFCVFARVRACFRGYLPLNCHHDLRGNPLYLLGFLNHSRPLPMMCPARSNVRAPWFRNPRRRRGRTSRRGRWHGCQVERHAVAAWVGKPSPLASRARERHAVAAFILARARSRSSSRRGRRRVDRHAVAAFILSTVPGPCSSWRGRREDREAVAVCMAMPRGAFWRCLACGQSFVGGMVGNRHGGK